MFAELSDHSQLPYDAKGYLARHSGPSQRCVEYEPIGPGSEARRDRDATDLAGWLHVVGSGARLVIQLQGSAVSLHEGCRDRQ